MKFIIIIKNRLENIYKKFPRITGYAGRLVFSLCSLMLLRMNCGYNATLTNIWTVLVLCIFCSFTPLKLLSFILVVYTMIQMFSLSLGVGCVCAVILLTVYLIFFRFDKGYIYLMLLIPLCSMARLVLLVPLVLAAVGSLDAIAVVLFGYLLYYMIRYVNLNTAVISGMSAADEYTNIEYTKMSYVIKGIFTDKDFLFTLIILTAVFLLVYYMRRLNLNQANNFAIAAGSGVYIILYIIGNMFAYTLTMQRLVSCVAGTIVSGLLAAFIVYADLPLDYTRIENFEFEDAEYHYYVRAVPKAVLRKESVRVKKINSRKEISAGKGRESGQ